MQEPLQQATVANFPWETLFTIIAFFIGLVVGLIQLWQAQKYFLTDQQSKFDEIWKDVREIAQRLAVMEQVTKSLVDIDKTLASIGKASDLLEARVFGLVERQLTAARSTQITEDAYGEIKNLFAQELANTGIDRGNLEKILRLEARFDEIFESLNKKLDDAIKPTTNVTDRILELQRALETKIDLIPGQIEINQDITVSSKRPIMKIGEREIPLGAKEYKLMRVLASKEGEPISIENIIDEMGIKELNHPTTIVKSTIIELQRKMRQHSEHQFITSTEQGYSLQKSYLD